MPWSSSPDDFDRLVENVRQELQAQNAIGELGLADDVLDQLASAIATNAVYAFEVKWAPKWLRRAEPHAWHDEEGAFAECVDCRLIFGPEPDPEAARRAFDEHWSANHRGEASNGV